MSLAGAHCGAHPAVAAVEICTRCGTFLCGDCVEYFNDETPACAACLPHLKGTPTSARARLSPVLAVLAVGGLVTGFLVKGRPGLAVWGVAIPLGFVGLGLAVMELRLMRASSSVNHGRRWARAGIALGGVFLLGFFALAALFVAFMRSARAFEH